MNSPHALLVLRGSSTPSLEVVRCAVVRALLRLLLLLLLRVDDCSVLSCVMVPAAMV
jgi:hypothetical protein